MGPIEGVGVEAMQAVGHMVAEVDARQRSLSEVLCIHDLHVFLNSHFTPSQAVQITWDWLK